MNLHIRMALLTMALLGGAAAPTARAQQGSNQAGPSAAGDLARAYKREFAFLEAEKNALQKRIADLEDKRPQSVASSRGAVDGLQARATTMALEADRLNELLMDADRAAEGALQDDDALDNLLSQANTTVTAGGRKLPEVAKEDGEGKVKQVDAAFAMTLEILGEYSGIRSSDGKFFATDGKEVTGKIVQVGNVARYGVAESAAGALVPAGGERLKVWPSHDSSKTARALAEGRKPELLRIFIFENMDKPVDAKKDKSWQEIVASGGVIAYVIVAGGCLALLLIVLRLLILTSRVLSGGAALERVHTLVAEGKTKEASAVVKGERSAVGRVVHSVLEGLGRPREDLDDVVAEAMLREQPSIDRFGSTIMVLAAVAPLLGLLGTVTGMISTFDVITEYGTGNPKLLSGGISEALVTTELGLIVAIPALLFGNMLAAWAEGIKDDMEKAALRVTNIATGVKVASEPIADSPKASGPRPAPEVRAS